MSETDPWKVAKSTIRARIADYSVALLGHSSGSQQAKENAQTAIDAAIDAARAAEAAQHQQALVDLRVNYAQSMRLSNETLADTLARLAAVEAERDKAVAEVCAFSREQGIEAAREIAALEAERGAEVTAHERTIDELTGLADNMQRLIDERDRLKAAAQAVVDTVDDHGGGEFFPWLEAMTALRAALTPQGQSTDGETR
jgi:hypothetical protein